MRWFERLFKFYLDASVHVAFAVCALYFVSIELLKVQTNWSLAGFLFFGTIVCYNFIKFGVEAEKYLIVEKPYHKLIQALSFISFGFAAFFFFKLPLNLWWVISGLMGVSVLYAIPLLPKAKNLRSFAGLKTFLVAFVWMGCTVLLVVVENNINFSWDIGVLMFQRFLLVLILLLPFEIRDMKFDKPELKTLPQRIGIAKTKIVGYLFVGFYIALEFLKDSTSSRTIAIELILSGLLWYVLYKTKENQKKYFYSFWVESIPFIYFLLLQCQVNIVPL